MVDDDSKDDTVKQSPGKTVRGVAPGERVRVVEEIGDAATIAAVPSIADATPSPLPPPPTGPTVPERLPRRRSDQTAPDLGRYQLRELLGQGGMGEVVLAFDDQIGREVAVKRIRASAPSGEELQRFVREARVQGRLEHPAVVPVHDLAVDRDGRPFFVMKRLSGTTLAASLASMRAGEVDDVDAIRRRNLRAFVDVCLAVEFAHARGIIHRDLKPANIMLGDFGEVYVLDWGVARAVAEADENAPKATSQRDLALDSGDTQVGTILGTPAYMAPEQMAGDRAGPAADIYALGCILFEIIADEPLHARSRAVGMAFETVNAKPSARRAESPPELDAICEMATALDRANRFATARALGNAVQAFLDGDRDIAVRKELAVAHIADARAAIARGDDEANRRDAMRAAGRALALDPTAADAADLVTRLMLEPPKVAPTEVDERVDELDLVAARAQGRLAATSLFGYLGFVPLLLWTGVRDAGFVAAFVIVALASATQIFLLTRRTRITTRGIYANACLNAVLIGLICRMVGPFIIAPTLAAVTLMGYAAHPRFGRIGIIATILALGVAVPWVLEITNVIDPTYRFEDGTIRLSST
ncbi:MAG TPA: serine/threonine-protein kinase, partial [Kofleriaceae bacterium]|nr:serine/threonine-protein kinase [Kofleriaceae bacterium]